MPSNKPRTKAPPRKLTNFDPLLQDIRDCLGENYVFYEECIVAIASALARKEDATAWYEQLQLVVEGNDLLAISHAGVLFLLGQLGETILIAMPPPPLPHCDTSLFKMDQIETARATALASPHNVINSAAQQMSAAYNVANPLAQQIPAAPFNNSAAGNDFLFNDPTFRDKVEEFWGVKASANLITSLDNTPQDPFNADPSYSAAHNFLPSYTTTADDLQIFRQRVNTSPTAQELATREDSYRAEREAEWEEIMRQANAGSAGK